MLTTRCIVCSKNIPAPDPTGDTIRYTLRGEEHTVNRTVPRLPPGPALPATPHVVNYHPYRRYSDLPATKRYQPNMHDNVQMLEEGESDFGALKGLKPAPVIEGAMPGYDRMSQRLGAGEAKWL